MWIPTTIPELILRVYTRSLSPEEEKVQRESGQIHSEDATWDDKFPVVTSTLTNFCIKKIAASYPELVIKVDEANARYRQNYEVQRAEWEQAWKQFRDDKVVHERLLEEHEQRTLRFSLEFNDELMFENPNKNYDGNDDVDIWAAPAEPKFPPLQPPPLVKATPILAHLKPIDRVKLVETLEPDKIPMELALRTIPDEHYWKPLAQAKFPGAIVEQYGNSWRRVYVEKILREIIEFFHPYEGKWEDFEKELDIYSPYALALELYNLIPNCYGVPRKEIFPDEFPADDEIVGPEDEGFLDSEYLKRNKLEAAQAKKRKIQEELLDEEGAEEQQKDLRNDSSHVDLSLVLPKIKHMRSLSIMYKMQEVGLSYEPRFQEFTMRDCENLATGLHQCQALRKFELQRSHVTEEMTKILCRNGLRYLSHLRVLNLSYNPLGNAGAKAIARLISDERSAIQATLHTLILTSCEIKRQGGKAIAYALALNNHLRKLTLRLNPLHDSGGRAIANALMDNKALLFLDMSATNMGPAACTQLGKMLLHNDVIREINFSSNPGVQSTAAGVVAKAVHFNKQLYKVDFRCCGIDEGLDLTILTKSYNNILDSGLFEFPAQYKKFSKKEAEFVKKKRSHGSKKGRAETSEEEEEEEETEGGRQSALEGPMPRLLGSAFGAPGVAESLEPTQTADTAGIDRESVLEGAKVPRRKLKPFELEERRLRYLMKEHGDTTERIYEPWLKGERLNKYIAFLEDKVTVKEKEFKRRYRRHRFANKSRMTKVHRQKIKKLNQN